MTDSELLARLEKLERDNRRLKKLGVAALVLAGALGLVAAARPVPQKIRAHEFDVVDNAGKVRTELTVHALRILDEQGKARLAAGVDGGEPLIDLRGATGDISLDTLTRSGMPGIWLLDKAGDLRAGMQLIGKGSVISLRPAGEKGQVTLSEFPNVSQISLADTQGYEMKLGDSSTMAPLSGQTQRRSAASIVMFGNDKKHHLIWQAP